VRVRAEVIVEVDGKEVYRGSSRSFVANLAKVLWGMFNAPVQNVEGAVASCTITAPDGTSQTIWTEWHSPGIYYGRGGTPMAMNAPNDDDSYGIVVGSGTTPVSPTDYKLSSKIPHGAGVGQLDYETHSTASSYSGTSSYVEISRSFINRSGSDVIVREVGLVARSYWGGSGGTNVAQDIKYLIARDVLPSPVTVKPLGSLTVRYRISLSM
jgi:hypothetical protein